ncbi:MAG: hypothetical protein ABIO74_09085 [Dokdonella sp.]
MLAILSVLLAGFAGGVAWLVLAVSIGFSLVTLASASKHWSSSPRTMGISAAVGVAALLVSFLLIYFKYFVHWTF